MYPYDRLVKTHVDDVRRSAALYRHAVQAPPPRTPQVLPDRGGHAGSEMTETEAVLAVRRSAGVATM